MSTLDRELAESEAMLAEMRANLAEAHRILADCRARAAEKAKPVPRRGLFKSKRYV